MSTPPFASPGSPEQLRPPAITAPLADSYTEVRVEKYWDHASTILDALDVTAEVNFERLQTNPNDEAAQVSDAINHHLRARMNGRPLPPEALGMHALTRSMTESAKQQSTETTNTQRVPLRTRLRAFVGGIAAKANVYNKPAVHVPTDEEKSWRPRPELPAGTFTKGDILLLLRELYAAEVILQGSDPLQEATPGENPETRLARAQAIRATRQTLLKAVNIGLADEAVTGGPDIWVDPKTIDKIL